MELDEAPVRNIAHRLVERHALVPPIDVKSLLKQYAELLVLPIPFEGVDGISMHLKVPGRIPRVIVNASNPDNRVRFTMAHELGHVVIPWHVGVIVDITDVSNATIVSDYWTIEQEANLFAAELLMPQQWLDTVLGQHSSLATAHAHVSGESQTSMVAAARRLAGVLNANIVYACERGGTVEFSGRTSGTLANQLSWGVGLPTNAYSYASSHDVCKVGERTLHWWQLPSGMTLPPTDGRPWREILNGIVSDLGYADEQAHKFKQSVNGIVAYANSACRRESNASARALASASLQRFHDRDRFIEFVQHPDFDAFLSAKIDDMLSG